MNREIDPQIIELRIIELFPTNRDGELIPRIEVAAYTDSDRRAIYQGSINPSTVRFDRFEQRFEPNTQNYCDKAWRGTKHFGQKSLGNRALGDVRRFIKRTLDAARENGSLLKLALEVAMRERNEAAQWAEARIRAFTTWPNEMLKSRSGGLLSAISTIESALNEYDEQVTRLHRLNRSVMALGAEFCVRRADDRFDTAVLFGHPSGRSQLEPCEDCQRNPCACEVPGSTPVGTL